MTACPETPDDMLKQIKMKAVPGLASPETEVILQMQMWYLYGEDLDGDVIVEQLSLPHTAKAPPGFHLNQLQRFMSQNRRWWGGSRILKQTREKWGCRACR